MSFQFLLTQYLQSLAHWSAISTALAFLPAGVIVLVLSVRVAGLLNRLGPGTLVVAAFAALVAGYAAFLRAGVTPDYPGVMLPSVILLGVAFGFGFSALTVSATSGVRNEQQGLAASLFQTSFQVRGAIVLAVREVGEQPGFQLAPGFGPPDGQDGHSAGPHSRRGTGRMRPPAAARKAHGTSVRSASAAGPPGEQEAG